MDKKQQWDEDRRHLERLRQTKLKRLRVLELREAELGQDTPAAVVIELEDIRQAISDIDARLAALKASAPNQGITIGNLPSEEEDARGVAHPVPPGLEAIMLLQPRDVVMQTLQDLISRGTVLRDQVRTSPPTSQQELDTESSLWHRWRQTTEQTLQQAFSSPEPLQRLKALKPRHLDFVQAWETRANALLADIEHELAYLGNLVLRLENYPEHHG